MIAWLLSCSFTFDLVELVVLMLCNVLCLESLELVSTVTVINQIYPVTITLYSDICFLLCA